MVLLFFALIIISISGCVILNKTGWDWDKYEKYSKFYDTINKAKSSSSPDYVEDYMVGMSQDTEFDQTWYLTFLNFKRGREANIEMMEQSESCYDELIRQYGIYATSHRSRCRPDTSISQKYYTISNEYRQKIEEMKPK